MSEPERAYVQTLEHADQVRMALYALDGWTFTLHAANAWIAKKPGWFDQYGISLQHCLDQIDSAVVRHNEHLKYGQFEPYERVGR